MVLNAPSSLINCNIWLEIVLLRQQNHVLIMLLLEDDKKSVQDSNVEAAT